MKNLNICIDIDGTITDPYFWLDIANYKNALQLSENGFKVLLIDTNYNRMPLNKNIIRVFNWNEIYEIVKEMPLHKKAM